MRQPNTEPKPFLINGQWFQNNKTFESVNPATGAVNYHISLAEAEHVDAAVEAAHTAARSAKWRGLLPHQRADILYRIAELIKAKKALFAHAQMRENGKVLSECLAQAQSAAATFRYYAAVCETMGAEITPPRGNYLSMVKYEPYGVVTAITPWNSPLTMEAQKVAPALAAGNAIVLKPSEITPSVALLLGELALEAGLPAGVLNVVTGDGAITGKHLVEHPKVRMVSFTGGTNTGRSIGIAAAKRLVPVG